MHAHTRNLDAILMQQLNSGSRSRSNTFADLEMLVSDIEESVGAMAMSPPLLSLETAASKSIDEDQLRKKYSTGSIKPSHCTQQETKTQSVGASNVLTVELMLFVKVLIESTKRQIKSLKKKIAKLTSNGRSLLQTYFATNLTLTF